MNFEGFKVVHPFVRDYEDVPGLLSKSEIESLIGTRGFHLYRELNEEDLGNLLDFQAKLQQAVSWGINPDLVGLEDFEIGIASPGPDPDERVLPKGYTPTDRLWLRSKKTGKAEQINFPVRGTARGALELMKFLVS